MQTKSLFEAFRTFSFLLMYLAVIPVAVVTVGAMETVSPSIYAGQNLLIGFLAILLPAFAVCGIALLIHESGHYLAARLQGMTITEVKLGWVIFTSRRRGFKLSFRRAQGISGWVKAVAGSREVRREMLLFVAGGPAANICAALICYEVSLWSFRSHAHGLAGILLALAVMNLFMGLANLLPVGRRIPSDGSRLYHWFLHGKKDAAQIALYYLVGASARGLRARDIPPQELHLLALSDNPLHRFAGGWFAMRAAMDRGDNASALKIFEEYGDRYAALTQKERDAVDPTWKLFLSEQAYLQALEAGHAFDARQELEAPGRETVPASMRLRLEAALHLAEGQREKARELVARARREASDFYDAGIRAEEGDQLDALESRLVG